MATGSAEKPRHKKEKGEEGNNVYVVMIIMIMITMIEIIVLSRAWDKEKILSPQKHLFEESLSHARGQIVKMLMQVEPYTKSAYPIQTHSNKPFGYSLF